MIATTVETVLMITAVLAVIFVLCPVIFFVWAKFIAAGVMAGRKSFEPKEQLNGDENETTEAKSEKA